MANLGLIELKIGLYIKVNVNAGQKNLKSISTNLPKMAFNWHKIGNFPSNFDVFFSKCLFFKDKSNGNNFHSISFCPSFCSEASHGQYCTFEPKTTLKMLGRVLAFPSNS